MRDELDLSAPDLRGGWFFVTASFEFDTRSGQLRTLIAAHIERWVTGSRNMIEAGQANDEFTDEVDAHAKALTSFALGVTSNSLIQPGAIDAALVGGGRCRGRGAGVYDVGEGKGASIRWPRGRDGQVQGTAGGRRPAAPHVRG